jgi:hypothetical protein
MFVHQPHAFMTKALFDLWMECIFVPELKEKKLAYDYKGRSILILDGCSAHESPKINYLCLDNHIDLMYLPPHTSDRTQPLDLLFFSVFKYHFARTTVTAFDDKQSNDVCRMTRALKASAAFDIIVQSFERAGIIPEFGTKDQVYFAIDLAKSAHLTELCTHPNYVQPILTQRHLQPFPHPDNSEPMLFKAPREPKNLKKAANSSNPTDQERPKQSEKQSGSHLLQVPSVPENHLESPSHTKGPSKDPGKKPIPQEGRITSFFQKQTK